MKKTLVVVIGVILLVMLVAFTSTYTVRYHELAIKTRFGKMRDDSVQAEAGLHFRLPLFAESVVKYDTRLQLLESPLRTVATADDQQVMVRAYLMWKVDENNARAFYENYDSITKANDRLKNHLTTALEQNIKGYPFEALVGQNSNLPDAERAVLNDLASLSTLGVKPVSVGISQVVLPGKTIGAVLTRMQVSRTALAEVERQKGIAEAQGIESDARTVVDKLLAFANQRAEEIRAAADEEAAQYLADMNEDAQLAIFLIWLDTLEQSLRQNTTIFLTDELAPWHMLNSANLGGPTIIPKPDKAYVAGPVAAGNPDRPTNTGQAEPDQSTQVVKREGPGK